MLKSIRIQNFKAWKDTGTLRLAPLTVLFGPNSAGKSSIGHLLLALKQTVGSADRKRALNLGDSKSLIDLGTFEDCLHGRDLSKALGFELSWDLPQRLDVIDPLKPSATFTGSGLSLSTIIDANGTQQPSVRSMRYTLDGTTTGLDASYVRGPDGSYQLDSKTYKLVRTTGRPWALEAPEKFHRISDQVRARFQNAGFLIDFALAVESLFISVHHLGPLRDDPRRIYQWSGESYEDVGPRGENAIGAMLAAQAQGRKINRKAKAATTDFIPFIAQWLKEIGVIHSFELKAVAEGRKEYEVLIRTHAKASQVRITDVGFGISQVLPAIVESFYAPRNSIVLMEQPEIHLHPQVQAGLADVFISAVQSRENGNPRNIQLIVESHSEHLLNRLQRRIAEKSLEPLDIAMYFCSVKRGESVIEELRIDEYGEISNWPENFFGNEMEEITARTRAAIARKQA
jgi:predicted ATPase